MSDLYRTLLINRPQVVASGAGLLTSANNLSDVADVTTARANLQAQPLDADLTAYAGAATAAQIEGAKSFSAWGDSLTAGTGGQTPWPTQFTTLTAFAVYNGGVGGETSTQIKTRFDADTARRLNNVVFWVGRNDRSSGISPTTTKANIAAMVASLGHTRYLVLGILTADTETTGTASHTEITALNTDLAAIYGAQFFDIRGYLISSGLAAAGITPTAGDNTDIAGNTVPRSLRVDGIHLTTAAYALVAAQVNAKLDAAFFTGDARLVNPAALASYTLSPAPIGSKTPNSGSFTTLSASTSIAAPVVTLTQSASTQPLVIRTSATTQSGGGIELQSSAGVSKFRLGLHNTISGSETDHLDISSLVGGNWNRGFRIKSDGSLAIIQSDGTEVAIITGSGSPEGSITASPGSLYLNTAGGSTAGAGTLYIKRSGVGTSSGWKTDGGGIQLNSPTTGSTVTMTNTFENNTLYLEPAGTLATLTVNLPGNSDLNQLATIATTQTIIALTIANASVVNGTVTTLAAGASVTFRCVKFSPKTWTRVA